MAWDPAGRGGMGKDLTTGQGRTVAADFKRGLENIIAQERA